MNFYPEVSVQQMREQDAARRRMQDAAHRRMQMEYDVKAAERKKELEEKRRREFLKQHEYISCGYRLSDAGSASNQLRPDPEVSEQRMREQDAARRRMQMEYDAKAVLAAERKKELEEKRRQDFLKKHDSSPGHRMSDAGHRMSDAGHRMSDAGHRMSDAGHCMSDAGHCLSDAGSPSNSLRPDPEVSEQRMREQDTARRRMQMEYDAKAALAAERKKELDEKRCQEFLKKHDSSPGHRLSDAGHRLSDAGSPSNSLRPDYNPRAGSHCGGRNQAPRRSCPGGNCSR